MPPICRAAVSWYVQGSRLPFGIGVRPTRSRPPALPRVSFANATGASPAASSAADMTGTDEAEHRRALDEAGAVALAGEEVVDDRVLRVGCLGAPGLEAPAGLSIHALVPS